MKNSLADGFPLTVSFCEGFALKSGKNFFVMEPVKLEDESLGYSVKAMMFPGAPASCMRCVLELFCLLLLLRSG